MGGMVYFGADDGTHGRELWKTDGTELGTVMVKDANARDCSSYCHGSPMYITVVGDIMYLQLTGTTTSEGAQLWKSDGTEQGTVMVKDLGGNGGAGSMPHRLTVAPNGSVYFLADDSGFSGDDLYITDGTEQGTNLVYDKSNQGAIRGLVMVGNILMFAMNGDLWKTDGTTSGTQLVKEINLGSNGGIPDSDHSVDIGGELLFFGHQGRNWNQDTWQIWKSDGTDSGTFQIAIGDEKHHHQCVTGLTGKEWFKSPHAAYTTYFTPGQNEGVLFIYYL